MEEQFPKRGLIRSDRPILGKDPTFGQWSSGWASLCLEVLVFEIRGSSPPCHRESFVGGVVLAQKFGQPKASAN